MSSKDRSRHVPLMPNIFGSDTSKKPPLKTKKIYLQYLIPNLKKQPARGAWTSERMNSKINDNHSASFDQSAKLLHKQSLQNQQKAFEKYIRDTLG